MEAYNQKKLYLSNGFIVGGGGGGLLSEGFLRLSFEGIIFGRGYFRGVLSELYSSGKLSAL